MSFKENLEALIAVDKLDSKWIFDHFKNYGVAAVFMLAAFSVPPNAPYMLIPYTGVVAAAVFFFVSICLFTLNFVQGMYAFQAIRGSPVPSGIIFVIVGQIWFISMQLLLFIKQ